MKEEIHPDYVEVNAKCGCGAEFKTKSIKNISVEVCAKCHPFYTNQQKFVDSTGRVDRFKRRAEQARV